MVTSIVNLFITFFKIVLNFLIILKLGLLLKCFQLKVIGFILSFIPFFSGRMAWHARS